MKLVLQLRGREGQPADQWSLEGHGMSIGRGDDNDWVLPDPNRHLSKQHCKIDFRNGEYFLTDTSTNGVFVNYATERMPQGATVPINDGDIIQLGSYEIVAGLVESSGPAGSPQDPFGDLPDPYEEAPIIAPRKEVQARESYDSPDAFVPSLGRHDSSLVDDPDPFLDRAGHAAGGPGGAVDALDPFAAPASNADEDLFAAAPNRGVRQMIPDDSDLIGPGMEGDGLEDDDPLAGNQQEQWQGPAASNHHSAANEYFRPPEVAGHSLPEDRSMIPDDFDDGGGAGGGFGGGGAAQPATPFPAGNPAAARPQPAAGQQRAVAPAQVPAQPDPFAPPAPATAQPGPMAVPGDASVGRAFLAAAGLSDLKVSDAEMAALMTAVGVTYRMMVEGMRELLLTRSSVKNEFRIDQTMIGPRENNPLKFSASPDEALLALLKPPAAGYMKPEKAVQEGFKDVAGHQMAMMAGMQQALTSLLERFDPESLVKRIESHSSLRDMVPGGKKARYWEVFVELYGEIAEEAEEDFQSLFGKEFSKAYKAHSRKM